MTTRDALDRTLRLMRDHLRDGVSDEQLIRALRGTKVLIVADAANAGRHAAQCAITAAVSLMARCGLDVYVEVPDVPLARAHPPLTKPRLCSALIDLGQDLIPDVSITAGSFVEPDFTIVLGDTPYSRFARPQLRIGATAWSANYGADSPGWPDNDWPMGGLAAGAIAAGETFKVAMRRLSQYAAHPVIFGEMYASCTSGSVHLAPSSTPCVSDLGSVDFISAGAITNACFYALCNLPDVNGVFRIIDPQTYDITSLNRCVMLRRSRSIAGKALELARLAVTGMEVHAITAEFREGWKAELTSLAESVLVGVDHIPTRWEIQRAVPKWLGIAATSHWEAQASYHTSQTPCAGCLHPHDDEDDGIVPTISFVSFWAGLWLATLLVRHRGQFDSGGAQQQVYFPALRPDEPAIWRSPIAWRSDCPVNSSSQHHRRPA